MTILANLQPVLDVIYGIITVGGIFYFAGQYKKGKTDQKSSDDTDALTTIKIKDATISALQDANKYLQGEKSKLGERVAVLEADNERLKALVDNRSPELETFMKETRNSLLLIERSLEALLKTHSAVTINQTTTPSV